MLHVVRQGETSEFILEGFLDETFTLAFATQAFESDAFQGTQARLNLKGITAGNSSGILHFITFLRGLPCSVRLEGVPVWMVWQFNIIHELLSPSIVVSSIQAEYYCEENDAAALFVLQIGEDIPLLEDYADFLAPYQEKNGHTFRPDFDETYLTFLSFWKNKIKM